MREAPANHSPHGHIGGDNFPSRGRSMILPTIICSESYSPSDFMPNLGVEEAQYRSTMSLHEDVEPSSLIKHVHNALSDLAANPFATVPNPPNCTKRASVALIIRVRPNFLHWPSPTSPAAEIDPSQSTWKQLDDFFSQPWAQQGDPECIFIKRAARSGDRWTSHVALPGGKRDPEDADDKATAIRETMEEVGIDLTNPQVLYMGNLPQRVITTDWGSIP